MATASPVTAPAAPAMPYRAPAGASAPRANRLPRLITASPTATPAIKLAEITCGSSSAARVTVNGSASGELPRASRAEESIASSQASASTASVPAPGTWSPYGSAPGSAAGPAVLRTFVIVVFRDPRS